MSRLIDVDNLKPDYVVAATSNHEPSYWYVSMGQINNAPTVEAKPIRHGRWKKVCEIRYVGDSYLRSLYECSVCGADFQEIGYGYSYCPNCGAKMDEEDKEHI